MRRAVLPVVLLLAAACSPAPSATVHMATPEALAAPAASPSPAPTIAPASDTAHWLGRATVLDVTDPQTLATRLAAAERTIRHPESSEAAVAEAGRVQQAAYRQLAANPSWVEPAIGALPDALRGMARKHVDAGLELRALTRPRQELPAWRIVEPPPAGELLQHYRAAEREFGIPWTYLASIHLVETRMGRIRGTSVAGARGPMQFMPSTWEAYGRGDIENARDSILAAGRYLSASGGPADMDRALFAYNRSRRYVRAIRIYAEVMAEDELAYNGYYHWQVYYRTVDGDALLEHGYGP